MVSEKIPQKLPDALAYMPRVILSLRDMDGMGKAAAVKDWIVATMSDNKEPINETCLLYTSRCV